MHITPGDWWERESARISDQEWRDVVDQDPDLTLLGEVTATTPSGETICYAHHLLATWNVHPRRWARSFDFRKCRVVVKNADDVVLKKMRSLAIALAARVQGMRESYN